MFFFVAYDGYRDRRQTESRLVSIPTLAQRRGDFSALPVAIYDPRTTRPNPNGTGFVRDPFPGNIIPAGPISPISHYFQSFLPDPTNGGAAEQLSGRQPADRVQQRQRHREGRSRDDGEAAGVGAGRARPPRAVDAYRGGTNAQTALPLPYTETRLVEEVPTTAQIKHTYVLGARWVNQASLGFSRLSVPIANATIDGRYPHQAGLTGLPAGEADSSFPEVSFAGPNAPTQWRGTDARAFTEYLNNYTLQNNLQLDARQACDDVRIPGAADGRQRARAHLRQPGDVRVQQRADRGLRRRPGTLLTATGNAYASFLLGDLNATIGHRGLGGGDERPVLHLRLLGAGRLR